MAASPFVPKSVWVTDTYKWERSKWPEGVYEVEPPDDQPSDAWRSVVELSLSGQSVSNKKQKLLKGHEIAEYNHLVRSEQEAKGRDNFDLFVENAISGSRIASPESPVGPPLPKFQNGHSIIQWWAPWMRDAEQLPSTYNKNDRPAWFKGEVLAHVGWQSVKYAGFVNPPQHAYHVY